MAPVRFGNRPARRSTLIHTTLRPAPAERGALLRRPLPPRAVLGVLGLLRGLARARARARAGACAGGVVSLVGIRVLLRKRRAERSAWLESVHSYRERDWVRARCDVSLRQSG